MKKPKKRIVTVLLALLGLFLVFIIISITRYSYAIRQMAPADTHAINDSVFCIRNKYVNAYLFRGYNGYMMIDAGINKEKMTEELARLEIDPGDILAVVLTHSDMDHSGGLDAFDNAGIFMHEEEEQMVNGETARFVFKSRWKHRPYNVFKSGEILNIDIFRVEVIHTPGHTPGSCCFVVNGDYLLTGDNLIVRDGKYENFFNMINMDTETQLESLKKLPPPGEFDYILTGHTGIIPGDEL